jgi:hypothetical protein
MDETIRTCKNFINTNDLISLQKYVITLFDQENDWPYLFQKVYLHACLKGQEDTEKWLREAMYPQMDPIQQIALRQIFPYGRHLIATAKRRAQSSS